MTINTSRRKFLKGLGLAGLSTTFLPVLDTLPGLGAQARASSGESPKIARQWVRIIDLKKCDGCEGLGLEPQCRAAHRQVYRTQEGEEWIDVQKIEGGVGGSSYWMPIPCMHCENAPCVKVCPVGATYRNENGTVLVDNRKCLGCRMCMAACPYDRRFFYWDNREPLPGEDLSKYSPEFPLPPIRGTVNKCVLCEKFTREDSLPVCVASCPRGAMYFGDLESDVATNGVEKVSISKLLAENSAYRYKEELGTRPRVYYLPGYGQEQGRDPRD